MLFEGGAGVGERVGPFEASEAWTEGHDFERVGEEVGIVGLEEELAPGREAAFEAMEELRVVDDAVLAVGFLRPRIGEEEVESRDAAWREEPGEGVAGLEAEDPGVLKAAGSDAPRGFLDTTIQALHAEEIAPRVEEGEFLKEGSVAAAEVDLEGPGGVGEQLLQPQLAEVIGGDEDGVVAGQSGAGRGGGVGRR